MPYSYLAVRSGLSGSWVERLVFVLLYMTVLVMAAKTNLISDYDSEWYGLRSSYVLEQGGSIFANLGLAHFVFYYPKLYEALILRCVRSPIRATRRLLTYSFYVLILYVVHDIVHRVHRPRTAGGIGHTDDRIGARRHLHGLAGQARSPRGPGTTQSLEISVGSFADVTLGDGLVGAAALAIALCVKLSAIPFGGLMFIASVLRFVVSISGR